jgi:hypothetical protein
MTMDDALLMLPAQAPADLRGLRVDCYGLDIGGHRRFDAILADWRQRQRRGGGADPFAAWSRVPRDALEAVLSGAFPEASGLLQGAVEDFAAEIAGLVRRLLVRPEWRGTQRVVVGGELRSAWIADIAVARAAVHLRAEGLGVAISPIRHAPGEAGLLGAARLVPRGILAECDVVPVAEIGPDCFRAGLVLPRLGVAPEMAAAGLWRSASWTVPEGHSDRAAALGILAGMLADLEGEAVAAGFAVAPAVALGVPGQVTPEGRLAEGAEALPGDWQAASFHLPAALARLLPPIGGQRPGVLLHNAAVTQGLSEAPFQRDVARWGVLTLGPSLGTARFTNLPMRS